MRPSVPNTLVDDSSRRVLCVFPRYAKSFGTFDNTYSIVGVKAFMPPQGLLVIAAYLPRHWEIRFVDENVRRATEQDFDWADAVFVSGMHIQRQRIDDINRRAHACGKITVLGGPSVSGCPEQYPDFDFLHIGELGDATDALIQVLAKSVERPDRQMRFETNERLPLVDFPIPAYERAEMAQYLLATIQFSSGCPYRCEFCDIPELYGNNPRLKTPEQVVAELDAILASGGEGGAVYFVDDNFVGNRKAAKELLPHLIKWQKRHGYAVQFACEATLNITKSPDLLEMMREAFFCTIFCGIETPDPSALKLLVKDHNNHMPVLDAVRIINGYGMEVVSGIIMGLDSDTRQTPDRILEFIEASRIPMLTINLLQALPRTPLYRRLQAEDRIDETPGRESNVDFRLPYDEVIAMWRRVFTAAYQPDAVYRRFRYNQENTYPHRIAPPLSRERLNLRNIWKGLSILFMLLLRVGILGNYRRVFWQTAVASLRKGDVETLIHVALVSHHLITFAREAGAGKQNASFYSAKFIESAEQVS
jgi:radical SAM superfamily enzyme YgiQ (UPF0313 family)